VQGECDEMTTVNSAWLGKTGAETRACELNEEVADPDSFLDAYGHFYVRTLKIEDHP
jgi:hypothetical protein